MTMLWQSFEIICTISSPDRLTPSGIAFGSDIGLFALIKGKGTPSINAQQHYIFL